jgi:hypothetical protein
MLQVVDRGPDLAPNGRALGVAFVKELVTAPMRNLARGRAMLVD